MKKSTINIYNLIIKELRGLWSDRVMLFLIIYSFTFAIYTGATAKSSEIRNATIAFVDEDRTALSNRIISSFYKPRFNSPQIIPLSQMDSSMDSGIYTFIVVIPSNFEKDLLSGNSPDIQVNIDATRMSQAGIGAGYIKQIISQELRNYTLKTQEEPTSIIETEIRYKYNPNLTSSWFGAINEVISQIMTLSILLSGAALIREREHGTIEHLLVMPLNAFEIMLSKILSVTIVILFCVLFTLYVIVQWVLNVPILGSIPLFLFTTFLVLFSTTSIGIFMGTIAKNMPQLGMIFILTILPIMILSGSISPFESMPKFIQYIMLLIPSSHFVDIAQSILFKGAGFDIIWENVISIVAIGIFFFLFALFIFRRSLESE